MFLLADLNIINEEILVQEQKVEKRNVLSIGRVGRATTHTPWLFRTSFSQAKGQFFR